MAKATEAEGGGRWEAFFPHWSDWVSFKLNKKFFQLKALGLDADINIWIVD